MAIRYYSSAWGAARSQFISEKLNQNSINLVIAKDQKQAELVINELAFFIAKDIPILSFPEYNQEPFEEIRLDQNIISTRAATLKHLLTEKFGIVVATPYSILRKLPPVEEFKKSIKLISRKEILPREVLVEILDSLGYLPVEVVTGAGEFCVRGGILDLFPVAHKNPVRIEYFDDEIDLLFSYKVETQKRVEELEYVELLPATSLLFTQQELLSQALPEEIHNKIRDFGKYAGHQWLLPALYEEASTIFDYLPQNTQIFCLEEDWKSMFERVLVSVQDLAADTEVPKPLENFAKLYDLNVFFENSSFSIVSEIISHEDAEMCKYRSIKARFAFEKGNLYYALSQALKEVQNLHKEGYKTVVAMESERFTKLLEDFCRDHEIIFTEIDRAKEIKDIRLYLYKQRISGGYIDEVNKLVFITDEDIFGFVRRKSRPRPKDAFDTNISDLEEGDFVVHIDYGIGVYNGLKHMIIGGLEGDYLEITYENNELLFVPLEQISQIQKYLGVGNFKPRLASLQSVNWSKLKASARKQAAKIAQDLLKLYAERKSRKGFAFKADNELLDEFEERFEYDETEDQLAAIIDIYKDMEKDMPMDRLVCGDVGFGKTEVAMRAACKAVLLGKQVAVLVPTTVLARQHFNTFHKRFKDMPVRVDYVSRFRTNKEIKKIKEDLAEGRIDILIGTHRILSSDIVFKDLRLLVIDEEQRFGVADKEKIAAMRSNIDVLALSATPIPRTLQLSLSGIREISIIETPPENRIPVAVKVIQQGDEVKKAIHRELERNGQIFFLHNRVNNITEVADYVKMLAPQARIAVAHGQTKAKELETILKEFYEGEIDILVSTTIIENGVDIPNVNAIFIDNAASFGLSQLYQLKGRVGRSHLKGYCYLLVDNMQVLSPVARKRLSIVQQLSDLGSGLKIAMYDLQLRGAGDILGAAQSGFVTKVGFELFIKMIQEAVAELQHSGDSPTEAEIITQFPYYISAEYIEDPKVRLEYYRTFSAIEDRNMMESLFDDLEQVYGKLKTETVNLGYIMLIKNLCSKLKVTKAGLYSKMLRITFAANSKVELSKLTATLNKMNTPFRFSGEYEVILSFAEEKDTLEKGLTFLELLNSKNYDNLQAPLR